MGTVTVTINGTEQNPYEKFGLKRNPFSKGHVATLDKLRTGPIRTTAQIREILKGFSEEFILLCCQQSIPGEVVKFSVNWPDR